MVDQTPSMKAVRIELKNRLGHISGMNTPQYIRPIIVGGVRRPDLGFSQHSYRNADDLMVAGSAQDAITSVLAQMKSEGFPVGTVLDRNYNSDHADHIHVEGAPKVTGDPEKPSTWNVDGSVMPTLPEPGDRVDSNGETDSETENGETPNLWDWITDPTGSATEAIGTFIAKIGWAILALVVLILVIVFILNEFSKSETGSNLVELAATRGTSAVKSAGK